MVDYHRLQSGTSFSFLKTVLPEFLGGRGCGHFPKSIFIKIVVTARNSLLRADWF
jgi:hypothetical protein